MPRAPKFWPQRSARRCSTSLTEIVARAARRSWRRAFAGHVARRIKSDRSPVTAADELPRPTNSRRGPRRGCCPGVPVIAEESVARDAGRSSARASLIVDPLDGTKEFLAGRDEFTVNLAIVTGGVPVAGIVAAPAHGLLWRGVVGGSAERLRLSGRGWRATIRARSTRGAAPDHGAIAAVSRSHLDARTEHFLPRLPLDRALRRRLGR